MNCPYLDSVERCKTTPILNEHYKPSVDEIAGYCTDESEMRSCPRLQIFESYLEALNSKGASTKLTNVNTNTNINNNVNTSSSNLSTEVNEAFEIAHATVDAKGGITQDEKDLINGRLLALERELSKGQDNVNKGKIQRLKEGFERYGWLLPTVIDILKNAKLL